MAIYISDANGNLTQYAGLQSATNNFVLIGEVTLTSASSTITFSNMSVGLDKDLLIFVDSINSAATDIYMRVNSTSGTNYQLGGLVANRNNSSLVYDGSSSANKFKCGYADASTKRCFSTINLGLKSGYPMMTVTSSTGSGDGRFFGGSMYDTTISTLTTLTFLLDSGVNFSSGSKISIYARRG